MKFNRIFFGIICMLMCNAVSSQIQFSPKFGMNVSSVKGEVGDQSVNGRIGWHLGLDLRIDLNNEMIFFHPGVYYQSMVAKLIKDTGSTTNLEDETSIKYLKVPLDIGFRLTGEGGLIDLHARGGVVPNILLGVSEKNGFQFDKDRLKSFNLGANLGVGLDVWFLTLDVQYEFGLTNFFNDLDGKNNTFLISLGFVF